MMATRIFLIGAIILFFGMQLREVNTFVLNEKVTKVVNKRIEKTQAPNQTDTFEAGWDPYSHASAKASAPLPSKRSVTPPRWLGWSLLSMGAVLVFTSPWFRT